MIIKSIQILIIIIVGTIICTTVSFSELSLSLSRMTIELALLLVSLSLFMVLISVLKWQVLLNGLAEQTEESVDNQTPLSILYKLYLVGYFVNLIFPSAVAGDAVRSWKLGKSVGQMRALAATVIERYTGLVAMVLLAAVFVWFVPTLPWQIVLSVYIIFLLTILVTVAAIYLPSSYYLWIIPGALRSKIGKPLDKLQQSFQLVGSNYSLIIKALAFSFLFHTLTIVNTVLAAYAVGWYDPNLSDLFVVVPLILLIGAIPISPQGLGIQEGAFYYFLQYAGATPAQALGVALVLRIKSYLLAGIGGILWCFMSNNKVSR